MQWLLLILTLALAACGGEGREAMLDNYVTRLGRAVDEVPAPIRAVKLPLRPRIADRDDHQQAIQINLLDFIKLRSCRLQATVAHKNSILGKLALPSQRLLNSVDFLRQVEPCIARMTAQGEPDIVERLQQAAAAKTTQLPSLLWQAVLGAEEARLFWGRPPSLAAYPEQTGATLISALEKLHNLASAWLAGDYEAPGDALEGHLQILATGDGGALLAAMGLLSEQLQRADQVLAQSRHRGPLCPQGRPNERGRILSNVVTLFLIGEVQPWSADLNRRYYLLWPALQKLEDLLAAGEPDGHRRWRDARDRAMEMFRAAPRNHVKMLSPILQQCALAPSRPQAQELAEIGCRRSYGDAIYRFKAVKPPGIVDIAVPCITMTNSLYKKRIIAHRTTKESYHADQAVNKIWTANLVGDPGPAAVWAALEAEDITSEQTHGGAEFKDPDSEIAPKASATIEPEGIPEEYPKGTHDGDVFLTGTRLKRLQPVIQVGTRRFLPRPPVCSHMGPGRAARADARELRM